MQTQPSRVRTLAQACAVRADTATNSSPTRTGSAMTSSPGASSIQEKLAFPASIAATISDCFMRLPSPTPIDTHLRRGGAAANRYFIERREFPSDSRRYFEYQATLEPLTGLSPKLLNMTFAAADTAGDA